MDTHTRLYTTTLLKEEYDILIPMVYGVPTWPIRIRWAGSILARGTSSASMESVLKTF